MEPNLVMDHNDDTIISNGEAVAISSEQVAVEMAAENARQLSPRQGLQRCHSSLTQAGMSVAYTNIRVDLGNRRVLDDVSGLVNAGEILAVMGPSGSGKTTLLNVLSGRLKSESGSILIGNEPVSKQTKRKLCYVLQQDIFFANLTLYETLLYTALLRLPEKMSLQDKKARVNEIIDDLDLDKCKDTIIGNYMKRGLSGGEKKRANIAVELLTDPALLFLDEPTSGLDSSTAYQLMVTLKKFAARSGKTVITTIHQPSSQIFHMFDKLLLLVNGKMAYFGARDKILDFFTSAGMPCYENYNPADFILEKVRESPEVEKTIVAAYRARREKDPFLKPAPVEEEKGDIEVVVVNGEDGPKYAGKGDSCTELGQISKDTKSNGLQVVKFKKLDQSSHTTVSTANNNKAVVADDDDCNQDTQPKWQTGFWMQLKTLTARTFKQNRPEILDKLPIIQQVAIMLITILLWFRMAETETSIMDRLGVIFFTNTFFSINPMFGALTKFPNERPVINKERSSGAYRLSAYYLAKLASELPLVLLMPCLSITLIYWLANLNPDPATFLAVLGIYLLNALTFQSIGLSLSATFNQLQQAITVAAVYALSTMLLGGFFARNITPWMKWIQYLSLVNYSYKSLLQLEFSPEHLLKCETAEFEYCQEMVNGTEIVMREYVDNQMVCEQFNAYELPIWVNVLIMFLYFLVFRLVGYLSLRYVHKPK